MNGRIRFGQYYGKSITSRIIQVKTWSPISHTSIFLPGYEHVIEAWGKGVTPPHHWKEGHTPGTRIAIMEAECTYEQEILFYDFAHAQIGKKYDFKGILGFGISANIHDKDKLFCSELGFACAQHAGIELLLRVEAHKVSPGLLNCSPRLKQVGLLIV